MSGNWWDILPRDAYSNLKKVETSQPWYSVYKIHDWLYCIYEDGQYDEAVLYLVIGARGKIPDHGGHLLYWRGHKLPAMGEPRPIHRELQATG